MKKWPWAFPSNAILQTRSVHISKDGKKKIRHLNTYFQLFESKGVLIDIRKSLNCRCLGFSNKRVATASFIACHSAACGSKSGVHHLRNAQWQRNGIRPSLSLSFSVSRPSNYPKPMKSPLARVEIKPTWLKTRLMAVGARHSTGGLFVVESLRANFSRGFY